MNGLATAPSSPQHLQALARANEVRLYRANLKKEIASGRMCPSKLFLAPPQEARSMSVADVLMSQRRWGNTRCRKFLMPLRISENKQLGTLTERQRQALSERLAGRALERAALERRRLVAA